jgi:enterochelin esterase-like enzyme
MIIVMPNGHAIETGARNLLIPSKVTPAALIAELHQPYELYPNSVINDVIPFIEKNYRAIPNREHRAIAGLSMGGAQSAFIGLNNVNKFAWVASFSGAFPIWPNRWLRTQSHLVCKSMDRVQAKA